MATKVAKNPVFVQSQVRAQMDTGLWLVDGAATFKAGQFCRIGADGLVYTGTTGAASGVGADAVHLLAMETVASAIGADTTRKQFALIDEDDVFEMNELDGAITEAIKGQKYGMDVTSNICTVDISDTTNVIFLAESVGWRREPILNDSSDTLARLQVKVLASALDADKV